MDTIKLITDSKQKDEQYSMFYQFMNTKYK